MVSQKQNHPWALFSFIFFFHSPINKDNVQQLQGMISVKCMFLVFVLLSHCDLVIFLCSKLALFPCFSIGAPQCIFVGSIGVLQCIIIVLCSHVFTLFCWCLSMLPNYILLLSLAIFSFFYQCSSMPPNCVLLLFINSSWLCFAGVHQHNLVMLYWCSLNTSQLCFVVIHQLFLVVFYWCSSLSPYFKYISNP